MTTGARERAIDGIVARGEIGGRTLQIVETGAVECAVYEPSPLRDGQVRVRTVRSAISPGTEMTFYGRAATAAGLDRWERASLLGSVRRGFDKAGHEQGDDHGR